MRLIDADALLLEFGEEPLNWTNSDSEIQAQRDYRLFTKIVKGAPTIDIKTEVAREIFESVRVNCVDNDGNFLYGAFMNLQLDTMNKYTKEGVGE